MTGSERQAVNLETLRALPARYNMTDAERAAVDFIAAQLAATVCAQDLNTAAAIADRSGSTWPEKAGTLYAIAYRAGQLDGAERMGLTLYRYGKEAAGRGRRKR